MKKTLLLFGFSILLIGLAIGYFQQRKERFVSKAQLYIIHNETTELKNLVFATRLLESLQVSYKSLNLSTESAPEAIDLSSVEDLGFQDPIIYIIGFGGFRAFDLRETSLDGRLETLFERHNISYDKLKMAELISVNSQYREDL